LVAAGTFVCAGAAVVSRMTTGPAAGSLALIGTADVDVLPFSAVV
jgi:hypothetical protein